MPIGQRLRSGYGRPDLRVGNKYNETSVHFQKGVYRYSPAIEGNF
jgi:hypothetical protein